MNRFSFLDSTAALFLKEIATSKGLTRVELAKISGLTKTTVSGVVTSLFDSGYITEKTLDADSEKYIGTGRRPTALFLSKESPLICGMLVHRGCLSVTLSGLDGKIYKILEYSYENITADAVTEILCGMFSRLKAETERKILGIGLACLGPISLKERKILKPNNFYGIENYAIANDIERRTSLPVIMQNDISAAAVAEALYGNGKRINDFIYLHLMNGIGSGIVLNGELYGGSSGNAGDLAHITVNMFGRRCSCGGTGCLESYANIGQIRAHLSLLSGSDCSKISFRQVISRLNAGDAAALSAMQEYTAPLSEALTSMLHCLDINTVIFGYDGCEDGSTLEKMLERNLRMRMKNSGQAPVTVKKSAFFSDAPLIGAAAIVAEKIFEPAKRKGGAAAE